MPPKRHYDDHSVSTPSDITPSEGVRVAENQREPLRRVRTRAGDEFEPLEYDPAQHWWHYEGKDGFQAEITRVPGEPYQIEMLQRGNLLPPGAAGRRLGAMLASEIQRGADPRTRVELLRMPLGNQFESKEDRKANFQREDRALQRYYQRAGLRSVGRREDGHWRSRMHGTLGGIARRSGEWGGLASAEQLAADNEDARSDTSMTGDGRRRRWQQRRALVCY